MDSHNALVALHNVNAGYGGASVLTDISLSVEKNSRWALIGPNGAGKSTLVKAIAGLIRCCKGEVFVDGRRISHYSSRQRAKLLAYVPQKPECPIPYSVHDFVMMGRYSAMGLLGAPTRLDREIVHEAMSICDIGHLAMRLMTTLSGGELQRVLLAGAVAQATPLLLLDEPTTFLDPAHERMFFEALYRLQYRRPLTLIMITHDINNALIQCTHIAALQSGKLLFAGTSVEFKNRCPEILSNIYNVTFRSYENSSRSQTIFGTWETPWGT